jgi:hypothetical protein
MLRSWRRARCRLAVCGSRRLWSDVGRWGAHADPHAVWHCIGDRAVGTCPAAAGRWCGRRFGRCGGRTLPPGRVWVARGVAGRRAAGGGRHAPTFTLHGIAPEGVQLNPRPQAKQGRRLHAAVAFQRALRRSLSDTRGSRRRLGRLLPVAWRLCPARVGRKHVAPHMDPDACGGSAPSPVCMAPRELRLRRREWGAPKARPGTCGIAGRSVVHRPSTAPADRAGRPRLLWPAASARSEPSPCIRGSSRYPEYIPTIRRRVGQEESRGPSCQRRRGAGNCGSTSAW